MLTKEPISHFASNQPGFRYGRIIIMSTSNPATPAQSISILPVSTSSALAEKTRATAQRVYQANAQTIRTQDQVQQTLVNLR